MAHRTERINTIGFKNIFLLFFWVSGDVFINTHDR